MSKFLKIMFETFNVLELKPNISRKYAHLVLLYSKYLMLRVSSENCFVLHSFAFYTKQNNSHCMFLFLIFTLRKTTHELNFCFFSSQIFCAERKLCRSAPRRTMLPGVACEGIPAMGASAALSSQSFLK
jgi:hypothetical protein